MNQISPIIDYHTTTIDAWDAMLGACEKAAFSIDLEEFILAPDSIGHQLLNVLMKRAEDGIRVRLLLDWWGCRKLAKSEKRKQLEQAGVEIRFFRPPEWNWLTSSPRFFPRDHRKILIIDKETTFAGGVCFYDAIKDWRDTMVEISSPLTEQFLHIFNATWQKVEKHVDESTVEAHPDFETIREFSVYANAPDSGEKHFTEALLEHVAQAKHNLKLAAPYFTPGNTFLPALLDALERKVTVEILLSNYSKYAPYVVGKRICGKLLEHGAQIYYYEPTMLHLKMMTIDDGWSAIGSCNLDGLSLHHNQEAMLVSTDRGLTNELVKHFEKDKLGSVRFSYTDWQARPLSQKLSGAILAPVKHYL